MPTLLAVLGFVARLVLTWLGTELIRNFLSGIMFGVLEVRLRDRLPPLARAGLAANSRAMASAAHLRAGRLSIPLCLAATVVTRILFWRRGNFDLLSLGLPIGLGVLVGVPTGILAFRRELHARFAHAAVTRPAGPRPAPVGRASEPSGIPWLDRAVERAQASESLRRRIRQAVQVWDTLEQLAGDVGLTIDDLTRPDTLRHKLQDRSAAAQRAAGRDSLGRQFDSLLAEIASEVARLEGRPDLADECRVALFRGFFDLAEKLKM